ncbi:MAG: ribonuclease Y, partial [Oscillospiraceae bacterium]
MLKITTFGIILLVFIVLLAIVGMFGAFKYGYSYRKKFAELKIGSAEEEANKILADALDSAEKDSE